MASKHLTTASLLVPALLAFASPVAGLSTTPSAFGVGKVGFKEFLARMPEDVDAVAEGGWYSLQQRYVTEVGQENFHKLKKDLPKDMNVVAVGGFGNLTKLAADPKAELVTLVKENLTSTGKSNYNGAGKLDAIIALLQSKGKGFNSVMVDGEWIPVLTRQGKASTKSQKILSRSEKPKALNSYSNFYAKALEFENLSYTPRGNGTLKALVKYNPVAANFEKRSDGKIVLRRISCDITDVSFQYRRLPKLPLPLRRKGGYLDFLYLDDDIRVTRGNRGGLFVHFRREYLEEIMG